MSQLTIEELEARQAELADLIAKFKQRPAGQRVTLPAVTFELRAGEHYAGAALDETGAIKHHVILMAATPGRRLEWKEALDWAADAGGELPTRQEQALLFANCKPHLKADWHWSSEANGEGYAWYCTFTHGDQSYDTQSSEGCAVAVRRFNP